MLEHFEVPSSSYWNSYSRSLLDRLAGREEGFLTGNSQDGTAGVGEIPDGTREVSKLDVRYPYNYFSSKRLSASVGDPA